MQRSLKGRTVLITGATRGIGRAIALRAARDGANVVIGGRTAAPHPTLSGTIYTVAEEVRSAGGAALPLIMNVRSPEQVRAAVQKAAEHFGGIDVCVNNAGAISLTSTLETTPERFDLMLQVNARGTFLVSQACLPYLFQAPNPHILNMAPPVSLRPEWLKSHAAYTFSKYGMSLFTLAFAAEFAERGVAVNSLWPRTAISTAAVESITGPESLEGCRTPEIVADATWAIVTRDARSFTGNMLIDEDVLRDQGLTDFSRYAVRPGKPLTPDLFIDP